MTDFEKYKKLLGEFVSFQSVSTNPKYAPEIEKTVAWLKKLLSTSGFKTKIWKGKSSNPIIFSEYKISNTAKTVLIYGHYDVQPAESNDGWKSDPFVLKVNKTKMAARGVVDNKGQILVHIATAINLIKKNALKYNLKFLIEGNEETGNDDLAFLMQKNNKKLACDILLVSDGELTNNKPTIEVSLRGGFNCTLKFTTGTTNVHSGIFGGAIPNAGTEIVKFLSKLINPDNSIAYKSFYKNVDKISKAELKNNKRLTHEAKNIAKLAGVESLLGPKGVDFYTITGLTPTIQITGLKVGYIDDGYANIVPNTGEVRLNFRTAASQKAQGVVDDFKKFVKENTPKYVKSELSFSGLHDPVKINTDSPYFEVAEKILNKVYGTKVNRKNVGGAIPFVGDVKKILGVDTLLIPLVNEDCNMHGRDENFDVDLVKKALEFSEKFLSS